MEFRIADTFTDSLARLTGEEQKAVKTAAFDLQLNPTNPGMSFYQLDKAGSMGGILEAIHEAGIPAIRGGMTLSNITVM